MPKKKEARRVTKQEALRIIAQHEDKERRQVRRRRAKQIAQAVPVILVGGRPTAKGRRLLDAEIQRREKDRQLIVRLGTEYVVEGLKPLRPTRRGRKRKSEGSLTSIFDCAQDQDQPGAERIAKRLGLSRNTARAGLKKLKRLGLYQPRPGRPPKITLPHS